MENATCPESNPGSDPEIALNDVVLSMLFYVLVPYKTTPFGLEKIKPRKTQLLCLPLRFTPLQKTLISVIHKPLSSSSSQTLLYSHIDLLLSHFLSYDDVLDNTATQENF